MPSVLPLIIYDGDCPFCSNYVRLIKLRSAIGPVRLLNARNGGPETKEAIDRGLDLNDGMILVMNGRYYHGPDCINRLALLSTRSDLVNKINSGIFSSERLSKALYPILRAGRNLTLRLLGRKKITL